MTKHPLIENRQSMTPIASELLGHLKATVEDPNVFCIPSLDEREVSPEHQEDIKTKLLLAWDKLYILSVFLWDRSYDREMLGPGFEGIHYRNIPMVHNSYWVVSYARAIRFVVDVYSPDELGVKFLYFMLGVLESGWEDHLHTIRLERRFKLEKDISLREEV